MPWYIIAVIVTLVLGAIATVLMIGGQRKPLTPGVAVFTVAVNALMIWAIVEGTTR